MNVPYPTPHPRSPPPLALSEVALPCPRQEYEEIYLNPAETYAKLRRTGVDQANPVTPPLATALTFPSPLH